MRSALVALVMAVACGAAAADELKWGTSLEEAKKTGKPIAYLRTLGDLDDKL